MPDFNATIEAAVTGASNPDAAALKASSTILVAANKTNTVNLALKK